MSIKIKGTLSKSLATLTMLSTVFSLAGFIAMPIAAHAVAPADYGLHEGDTISAVGSNDPDIYIVNDWGYKRLFVNPAIFTLYGHLSWAGVKSVSVTTRDAFGTSGLFRNCETGDAKVYGLEVISEDVANLRWVNTSGAQAVADDPNFFKKVFCINSREQALYGVGANYTSVLQVPVYTRGGVVPPVVAGNVTVSLASDNPVSSTLIETQAAADLAHFTFTGSGAVTSLVLNRLGVSSDTTLANVYLYNGSKRLTDAATVSQGKITFSDSGGLFTVSGAMNIAVKSDIADSTTGQTVGVQVASVNGTAVSVSGNLHTIAVNPTDFGTIAVGVPTPATAATIDPQTDYNMWQSTVTVGNHDAYLRSLQLRVIGSVLTGDLRNFRLYLDGVQIGSVAQVNMGAPDNGYIVFDLGSGVLMKAGSRVLKVVGDIIGGSTKTFSISLRQKPDINVVESQYGVSLLDSTGTYPAAAPTTSSHTISSGSLTVTKTSDSPSGDVIEGATGVSLVKYKFEAFGEALKVENLYASFTSSTVALMSLRNGAIYVDGAQVGSIQSLCEDSVAAVASCSTWNSVAANNAGTQFNLGSSLVIQPGTPRIVEIRSDIYDNTGVNNATSGQTISAYFQTGSANVQRLTSLDYFNGPTADSTAGNTLTIKTGSFAAAKYTGYTNQSFVPPQSLYKMGAYTLTAASSEDVNVNTIIVGFGQGTSDFDASADLTNLFVKVYDETGALRLTTTPKSTVVDVSASNSFSVNLTIPKTKTYRVEVYANIGSAITSGALISNLGATGQTANSATSVTATNIDGQTITFAAAALNLANGASPASAVVNGGTRKTVYVFTLQPQYDSYYLDEATFKINGSVASSTNAVTMAYLMDGTTLVGSSPITVLSSRAIDMAGLNYPISGGTKTFTLQVDLANVGVNQNDTGGIVKIGLSHLKYRDSNGNITTSPVTPATYTGNSMYVYAGYPVFSNISLPSTILTAGSNTLFKTQVSAVGGSVAWRKVVFTIGTTSGPTLSGFELWENNVKVTTASISGLMGHDYATASRDFNTAGTTSGTVTFAFSTDRSIPANGSVTLELKATVGGTVSAGHSIVTKIANPGTWTAPDDVNSLTGGDGNAWRSDVDPSFIWSDSSSANHSASTDDWMGDYLIQGLAASQALYQ